MKTDTIKFKEFELRPAEMLLLIEKRKVKLRKKELQLLLFFVENPNKVISKFSIMEFVWQYDYFTQSNTIEVHVYALRRKLRVASKSLLQTVYGAGYLLKVTSY